MVITSAIELYVQSPGARGRVNRSGVDGWSGPGRRRCASEAAGVVRTARGGSCYASTAAISAAVHVMIDRISDRRRRTAVSLSSQPTGSDSVDQLDRIVEILHQVNRTLPLTVLCREELIALGGLLTQINSALLTLVDLLSIPTHHYDRTRLLHANTNTTSEPQPPSAAHLLQDCRDGYLAAYRSARALHADLRRCPRPGPAFEPS
jgi:hypothetical protein